MIHDYPWSSRLFYKLNSVPLKKHDNLSELRMFFWKKTFHLHKLKKLHSESSLSARISWTLKTPFLKVASLKVPSRTSAPRCFQQTAWMFRWKLLERLGSVGYNPNQYPIYKQVISHFQTIDPNFLGHPSETFLDWQLSSFGKFQG